MRRADGDDNSRGQKLSRPVFGSVIGGWVGDVRVEKLNRGVRRSKVRRLSEAELSASRCQLYY